ncbi:hypothetical protein AC792_10705 [Arthrobacter sp. RIT-PI-e]|uniref:hypothetical protein n=1 Tax=Arthrobacter sp. RIT-PI-e TaxID=1681197 RepID=UPI0006762FF3|nr:hypothetical protein [Arthrobacter sp. RIT-PI-e]KNC18680.1 hypothetical protein AC792_10705 [Arthrobacter sp. RIT-PI-e]
MTDIPRTPRGRQEKLGIRGTLILFSVPSILTTAFRGLGLSTWESIGIALLVVALGTHLVSRPVRAARRPGERATGAVRPGPSLSPRAAGG